MPPTRPPRRADAQRSFDSILDAALDALASDPEASMAEIARRAGVVRATIYVHFPTREALIAAVTERAVAEVTEAIEAAEPTRGEARDALERVVAAAWSNLGRFHALVEVNTRLPQADLHAMHHPVLAVLQPLIERGQRDGSLPRGRPRRLAPLDAARARPRRQRRALRGPDPRRPGGAGAARQRAGRSPRALSRSGRRAVAGDLAGGRVEALGGELLDEELEHRALQPAGAVVGVRRVGEVALLVRVER